jgi:hypothetical protein
MLIKGTPSLSNVGVPGLVPGIHVLRVMREKAWVAGTSPAKTTKESVAVSPATLSA